MRAADAMTPTLEVGSVGDIPVDWLLDGGTRCVMFDLDNTCVPRGSDEAPAGMADMMAGLRGLGMATCVVSNNFRARRVREAAAALGCDHAFWAMNPLPFALLGAMRKAGVDDPAACVMVGDQPHTDVLAGNLAGMRTVLVRPQDPGAKPLYAKAMRRLFDGRR